MKRTLAILVVLFAALVGSAVAQSLADLLPAETFAAFGTKDLAQHQDLLNDFIAEFNRLGVADAVQAALAGAEQQADVPDLSQMPEELKGIGLMDAIGQEAWLSVSAGASNPLPAVTVVARVSPKLQDVVSSAIEKNASAEGVQTLTEGSITFYVETVSTDQGGNGSGGGDAASGAMPSDVPVAYAQDGDLVAFSTNPDTLRGVLRRHQGASEPSFTGSAGYAATLGKLQDGNVSTYLDLGTAAGLLEPFVKGQGFDAIAGRLLAALRTVGTRGGVMHVTDTGLTSEAIQALDASGNDAALYDLLASSTSASTDPLGFVPDSALSVQSGRVDLSGWWGYLGDLIASAPELGVGDLNQTVTGMTGLDLRTVLFDWMGTSTGSIVTDAPTVSQPGMPGANLLGDTVILVQAKDETAAAQGLGQFFTTVATQLSAFTSAGDTTTGPNASTRDVGGVTVASYTMGPGITISYAVTDGYALIATSDTAMDKVLAAHGGSSQLPSTLAAMRAKVPQDATSFSLADASATMKSAASSLSQALQMSAGLGGSQGLDIDKVQAASDAVQQFLTFVASRMGGEASYSQVNGSNIVTHGSTEIRWH